MIEHEEFNNHDYLGRLISQTPLDTPSDDFINKVMSTIQAEDAVAVEHKSLLTYFKSALPYAALVIFALFIGLTSDLPSFMDISGDGYFMTRILNYVASVTRSLGAAFSIGYVSWGILIGVAGGFIYIIDQAFTRKSAY